MKKYFHYIWYVLRHKWFVLLECWRHGLYWRGIKHDWSKFLPSELIPYVHFFNGQILRRRSDSGYYKPHQTNTENWKPLGYDVIMRLKDRDDKQDD